MMMLLGWAAPLAVALGSAAAEGGHQRRGLRLRQHEALVDFVREGNACTTCTVKLFFVHLHKCGGTTLEAHLQEIYGERYLVPDTGDEIELRDALVRQNASRLGALRAGVAGYRVFARHIAYGFHAAVGCQRPLYLTLLREPVGRLLSIFGYLNSYYGSRYRRFPANATFADFVALRRRGSCATGGGPAYQENCISNYMTRKVCGYYGLLEKEPPGEETFECAARNLDLFFFVGVVERMGESLCALRHLLKWDAANPKAAKRVAENVVLNPSDHAKSAPPDADLRDVVKWDALLFDLAQARLDETLRHAPPGLCDPRPPPPTKATVKVNHAATWLDEPPAARAPKSGPHWR